MKSASFVPTLLFVCGVAFFSGLLLLPDGSPEPETRGSTDTGAGNANASVATAVTSSPAPVPAARAEFYGSAALKREDDGHYWARANMDGQFIRVMVDTGASIVALTRDDARTLGFELADLDYSYRIRTAGGEVMGAYITIESVKIGGVEVENVEAMVLQEGLTQSLLGMSFLGELYSYEFKGETLILRK